MFIFGLLKMGFGFALDRMKVLWEIKLKIAGFIIDRWRVFLVLAILGACLLYVHSLRSQRDSALEGKTNAEKALSAHIKNDNFLAEQRAIENKQKAIQGKLVVNRIKQLHHDDMVAIILSANGQIDKVKGEANHEKQISDRTIGNFRDSVRLALEREASLAARLPKDDGNHASSTDSDTASTGQDYIETLEQAGAICAADYNLCRDYVQSEQERLGIEK
jgi:hypothetical protein